MKWGKNSQYRFFNTSRLLLVIFLLFIRGSRLCLVLGIGIAPHHETDIGLGQQILGKASVVIYDPC